MTQKFYRCEKCGNIIAMVHSSGPEVVCCGETMKEMVPNTSEVAFEKHLPVIEFDGNKVHVKVGSVEHPMIEAHYIQWISIETKQGNQRKLLTPGSKPEACFSLC